MSSDDSPKRPLGTRLHSGRISDSDSENSSSHGHEQTNDVNLDLNSNDEEVIPHRSKSARVLDSSSESETSAVVELSRNVRHQSKDVNRLSQDVTLDDASGIGESDNDDEDNESGEESSDTDGVADEKDESEQDTSETEDEDMVTDDEGNWEDIKEEQCPTTELTLEDNTVESDFSDGQSERCPICLNKFLGQDIGTPESCDHAFCFDCLQEWAKKVNTCPVDRSPFGLILIRHELDGKITGRLPVENVRPDGAEQEVDEDATYCEVCGRCDREDRLLLCDACDLGFHCECLDPPLDRIPIEEWYCPDCTGNIRPEDHLPQDVAEEFREMLQSRFRPGASVFRRGIARTRASETVRSRIQRRRRADVGTDGDADSTSRTRSQQRRRPWRRRTRRKRTYRRKKTTRKRSQTASNLKTKSKQSSKKVPLRKKGKRKKSRKKKKTRRALAAARPLVAPSVKKRIAEKLGLKKPPHGHRLPWIQRPDISRSARSLQADVGIAPLSLFGERDELCSYDEGGSEGSCGELSVLRPLAASHSLLHRRKVEISAANGTTKILQTSPAQKEMPLISDVLGSILQTQALLHTNSQDVLIQRDGSLTLKMTMGAGHQRPQKPSSSASPHTPSSGNSISPNRSSASSSGNAITSTHLTLTSRNGDQTLGLNSGNGSGDEHSLRTETKSGFVSSPVRAKKGDSSRNQKGKEAGNSQSDDEVDLYGDIDSAPENEMAVDLEADVRPEEYHGDTHAVNMNAQESSDSSDNGLVIDEQANGEDDIPPPTPGAEDCTEFQIQSPSEESLEIPENCSPTLPVPTSEPDGEESVLEEMQSDQEEEAQVNLNRDSFNLSVHDMEDDDDISETGAKSISQSSILNAKLPTASRNSVDDGQSEISTCKSAIDPESTHLKEAEECAGLRTDTSNDCDIQDTEDFQQLSEHKIEEDPSLVENVDTEDSNSSCAASSLSINHAKMSPGYSQCEEPIQFSCVTRDGISFEDNTSDVEEEADGTRLDAVGSPKSVTLSIPNATGESAVQFREPAEEVEDVSEAGSDDFLISRGFDELDGKDLPKSIHKDERSTNEPKVNRNKHDGNSADRQKKLNEIEEQIAEIFGPDSPVGDSQRHYTSDDGEKFRKPRKHRERDLHDVNSSSKDSMLSVQDEDPEDGEIIDEIPQRRIKDKHSLSHHDHVTLEEMEEYADVAPRINISDLPRIPKIKKDNGKVEKETEHDAEIKRLSVLGRIDAGSGSEVSWKKLSKSTRERSYRDGKPKDEKTMFKEREIKKDEKQKRQQADRWKEDNRGRSEKWQEKSEYELSKDRRGEKQRENIYDRSRDKEKKTEKSHESSHKDKHKHKHKESREYKSDSRGYKDSKEHKSESKDRSKDKDKHKHSHSREHSSDRPKEREVRKIDEKLKIVVEKKDMWKEDKAEKHDKKHRSEDSHRHHEHRRKERSPSPYIDMAPIESKEIYAKGDSIIINVNFNRSASKDLKADAVKTLKPSDLRDGKAKGALHIKKTEDDLNLKSNTSASKHHQDQSDKVANQLGLQKTHNISDHSEIKSSKTKLQAIEKQWCESNEPACNNSKHVDKQESILDNDADGDFGFGDRISSDSEYEDITSHKPQRKLDDVDDVTLGRSDKRETSTPLVYSDVSHSPPVMSFPSGPGGPRSPPPPSPPENDSYDPCEPTRSPSPAISSVGRGKLGSQDMRPLPPPSPEMPPLPPEPEPKEVPSSVELPHNPKSLPHHSSAGTLPSRTLAVSQLHSSSVTVATNTVSQLHGQHSGSSSVPPISVPNFRVPPPHFIPRNPMPNTGAPLVSTGIQPISWPVTSAPTHILFSTPQVVQGNFVTSQMPPNRLPGPGGQLVSQVAPLLPPPPPPMLLSPIRLPPPPPLGAQMPPPALLNMPLPPRMSLPHQIPMPNMSQPPPSLGSVQNLMPVTITPTSIISSTTVFAEQMPPKVQPQDVTEVVDMDVDSPYSPGDSPILDSEPEEVPPVVVAPKFAGAPRDSFDALLASGPRHQPTDKRAHDISDKGGKSKPHDRLSNVQTSHSNSSADGHHVDSGQDPAMHGAKKPRLETRPDSAKNKHIVRFEVADKSKLVSATPVKKDSKKSEKREIVIKMDEMQLKILDDLPSSAVEMQVKEKFLKKLNRQERVVEEVKLVLKPHYSKRDITKEEYKEILRKSVPKICHNKSGEINPVKIKALVEGYVAKVKYQRKKAEKGQKTKAS